MSKVYRASIYMNHSAKFVEELHRRASELTDENFHSGAALVSQTADELDEALRKDQHELFHDGEFYDGCDICDEERKRYA